MKKQRAYKRLLCAILEKQMDEIIERLVYEAVDGATGGSTFDEEIKKMKAQVYKDALNYYIHYQGSRPVAVLKNSPLGRKLAKGAFKDE